MTTTPRPAWPLVVTGAVCGLAWACGLRGWMVHMAGEESTFHWYGTFALLLAPGMLAGAAFGLAEHRRRLGGPRSRWLILAPLLFLAALADPTIFRLLITSGIGGGAVGVTLFGLAGGYALSGRGRTWARRACGVFAVLGVLLMLVMASDQAPLGQPYGTWVGLDAASLLAVLCLACAIPQRVGRPTLVNAAWQATVIGALVGFAWAASLRAFMSEVAGADAQATWSGTFGCVLLPGALVGALLARAEWRRWRGDGARHRRWLVWSPMLFAAVLVSEPAKLMNGFDGRIGLAAVAVPAVCIAGGYAISGRGPLWVRGVCASVIAASIPIWVLGATAVGGAAMSPAEPHGAWAAVLYWALLATFALAAAIPHRRPPVVGPLEPQTPTRTMESPSTTATT